MSTTDVLIVGAGPTGLALAIWLTKLSIRVRILDAAPLPATTTRALAVQARTLELYSQISPSLGALVASRSARLTGPNIWVNGERRARVRFTDVATGTTAFPFIAVFPQDEHERLLTAELRALGVDVERGVSLRTFTEAEGCVRATLERAGGEEERCQPRYVAGCDGAHSAVRRTMGVGFPGDTYEQTFYVADVEASGPAMDGELHLRVDTHDFLGVFPLAQPGRAVAEMKLRDVQVRWFATYRTHHRVAERFRRGRAFLLGDAAHIHSPAGGQGLNTGVGDAVNLAWKLAAVVRGEAPDGLLETYEEERGRFARELVRTTDRAFTFMTSRGWLAGVLRTVMVRWVVPLLFRFKAVRRRAFHGLSQFVINYSGTALAGRSWSAGSVRAGERLPWVRIGEESNYESLAHIEWQLHVYGKAGERLAAWCKEKSLRLTVMEWAPEHGEAGLVRDALYLLRPDTYVALIDDKADTKTIEQYFAERQISLGSDRVRG
ncbi:PheA/TfdB family FAD-binding monooxygenase [Cordyceps fumosorosea ARSEF 2679]|uniref:PheA/TfdB family FAD-binding monooxygenase n=1 Tax=Cordyceps fumosorosea (strain ARSEF 2679) TaxID=1081104 RepID=A0A168EU58_CORFA|nr:PheA/TfdB family FAD-binding monooxygenase [Cordyceps fumosorosea ARSEF 2679]OAA74230.1 PheA/TfdB family FAD-binding monooxygenase [Cordyceps fumosorosea ARSEF 2679]